MLKRLGLALAILVLGAALVVVLTNVQDIRRPQDLPQTTLSLFYGGEKGPLLQNEKVRQLLHDRHGITLDAQKAGSIEQVTDPALLAQTRDCRWPSNQVAYDLYAEATGSAVRQQNIFNSPIVIYTWLPTAEALIKVGIVEKRADSYYIVDMPRLIAAIEAKKPWKDLGLPYFGPLRVHTSDPTRSNSGNMFAALLATMMAGGETVTEDNLPAVLPRVVAYFRAMGQMDHTSSDTFESFLGQGEGGRPLTVGYENQIAEYALLHPQSLDILRRKVVTLYPVPTIWSSHPLIAERKACDRLIDALKDPDIQRIAWEQHGFRTGLIGVTNDPKVLTITGVPETITAVVPMPSAGAMRRIIDALTPPDRSQTK